MNVDDARTIGPFVGAFISLIGFTLVWRQVRTAQKSMEAQARGLIYQLSNNVYKIFLDNPELRPYFYENRPIPSTDDPRRNKVLAAAELMCDYFEHIYFTREHLASELQETWISYMKMLYQSSDVLKTYINERESLYSPSFLAEIKSPSEKTLGLIN